MEGNWDVYEQLEGILKQGEINVARFLFQDGEILKIGGIASGAAAGGKEWNRN